MSVHKGIIVDCRHFMVQIVKRNECM